MKIVEGHKRLTRRECYQSCRLATISSFDEERQEEVGEEEVAKIVGAKLVLKALQDYLISSIKKKLHIFKSETSEVSFLGPNIMPALLISTSTGLPS